VCKDIFLNAIIASKKSKNTFMLLRIFRTMPSTAKHVLILPKWYPNVNDLQNGSFIRQFALELSNNKEVTVIFPVPTSNTDTAIETKATGQLLEVFIPYKASSLPLLFRKYINYKRYMDAMKQGVNTMLETRKKPDLIHVHVLIRPGIYAHHLSQKWNIPWVITEHSSDFLNADFVRRSGVKKWFIKHLAKRSCGISAVSSRLALGMKTLGVKQRIEIIPNLIAFPEVLLPSVDNQTLQIAGVADLVDDIKNISGVLKALALVKAQLPAFQYHLVGDGRDRATLEAFAKELKLEKEVIFHGRQNHAFIMDFLPKIDFLITNSRFETFSLVTAEAIACGKPVIVSKCGGPEEWFKPEYGLMIPLDDEVVLAHEILKMASGFKAFSAERMSETIKKQFATTTIMEQYDSLYKAAARK
jgi:glycosyltransferase involved in cell wall biosynthesis